MRIQPFRQGPPPLVQKMNEIIAVVNSVSNMTGDGLVQVARTPMGMALKINPDRIAPFMPKVGGKGGGFVLAIVTQIPEYDDDTKNKFVVQKASINTDDAAVDSSGNPIAVGDWVGDGVDIDIFRALNYEGWLDGVGGAFNGEDDVEDIRNWWPWYPVDSIVRIVTKWDATSEPPAPFTYIDEPMMYGGAADETSMRAHATKGFGMAVWK